MLRHFLVVLVAAVALAFSSCDSSPAPDLKAEENAVRTADEQWSAMAAKNDVDGTVAFYADDAVLLPPNAPLMEGKKAIRDAWAGLIGPNVSLSWKPTKIEVAKSGELAYLYGTYLDSVKDPKGGPAINDTGKMVEVWKKQADGQWKCIVDTYSSDLAVAVGK